MAKAVQIKWLEKRQFVGTDATKHSVVMSSQDEENGVGMSPSQLLLVALGGCTAYDVVDILQKKRQQLTGLTVTVTGEQEPDPPWPYCMPQQVLSQDEHRVAEAEEAIPLTDCLSVGAIQQLLPGKGSHQHQQR